MGLGRMWSHRAAPAAAGLAVLVVVLFLLIVVDAFSPGTLPQSFTNHRQLIGIDILLTIMPAYFVFALGMTHRRSRALLSQVDALLIEPAFERRIDTPASVLAVGAGGGLIYAVVFNLPISGPRDLIEGDALLRVLIGCMILVWVSAGILLAARLYTSGLFLEAGRRVPVDLFDQSLLEPFARVGMGDMLVVVGALVLSTVQSIDATFRTQNYLYALVVAIPAAFVLVLRPMLTVHARLKVLKHDELAAIGAMITTASRSLEPAAMLELEMLLKRRERVQAGSTWPIDVAMISRLILYGVIPPAAWIGAALVEHLVETVIAG